MSKRSPDEMLEGTSVEDPNDLASQHEDFYQTAVVQQQTNVRQLIKETDWLQNVSRATSLLEYLDGRQQQIDDRFAQRMLRQDEFNQSKKIGAAKTNLENHLEDLRKSGTKVSAEETLRVANLDLATAQAAFEVKYEDHHGGVAAFLSHLEEQRKLYLEKRGSYYPFFAIIQSSGYGKSKLVKHLVDISSESAAGQVGSKERAHDGLPRVLYLSFANNQAFPRANVNISTADLASSTRWDVQIAFLHLFEDLRKNPNKDSYSLSKHEQSTADTWKSARQTDDRIVLIAVDEVSQLLEIEASDKTSFYRCFRRATEVYVQERRNFFFVVMATLASICQTIPELRYDPSLKGTVDPEARKNPTQAFLLHQALALRNSQSHLLNMAVKACHNPVNLLSMGRPLWKAFIDEYKKKNEELDEFVNFALTKLLLADSRIQPSDLGQARIAALLSCRLCLAISPLSWVARSLVGAHMATAVEISDNREEVFVSYPSEPALAISSRFYMENNKEAFLQVALVQLRAFLTSGIVLKGHRGEVIMQLLLILAIDKCMNEAQAHSVTGVAEIPLQKFLEQFERPKASIVKLLSSLRYGSQISGSVCFTHFIYLEREDGRPLLTPKLLRYAYRRTAAIVMDSGRRGIDWVIPVRINNDRDEYYPLCGQVKNRAHDKMENLKASRTPETSYKVRPEFILSKPEIKLFRKQGWRLDWPALLFAIGCDDLGVDCSKYRPRTRRSTEASKPQPPPCIILTGLGFNELMNKESNSLLKGLRDCVRIPPKPFIQSVPLTYGVHDIADQQSVDGGQDSAAEVNSGNEMELS